MNKLIIGALLMTIFFNSLSDNIIPPKIRLCIIS